MDTDEHRYGALAFGGKYSIIRGERPFSSKKAREEKQKEHFGFCRRRRSRVEAVGARGPQNRAHARHAHLHLAQRQSRRRKTVSDVLTLVPPILANPSQQEFTEKN